MGGKDIRDELRKLRQAQREKLLADFDLRQTRREAVAAHIPVPRLVELQSLYFIRCGDAVKVGRAIDPETRMKELQTGAQGQLSLYASFEGAGHLENYCHRTLADQRLYGEWYLFDERVTKLVQAIRNGEIV